MLLSGEIYNRLTNDAAIAAAVGTQIYPEYVREADKSYPLIVYKKENTLAVQCYNGPTGLQSVDVVIACISPDHDAAEALASIVLNELDGDTSWWGNHWVQGCFLKDDGINENIFTEDNSEDLTLYVTELNFTVWYNTGLLSSSSSGQIG